MVEATFILGFLWVGKNKISNVRLVASARLLALLSSCTKLGFSQNFVPMSCSSVYQHIPIPVKTEQK
jgi:hypothetical protein